MAKGIPITPEQIREALDLRRRFWTTGRIAARLGVHRVSLARRLAAYDRQVARKLDDRSVRERARQLDQLEWIAEQAAEQWERSKRNKKSVKRTTGVAGYSKEGKPLEVDRKEVVTTGQTGDPRFLGEMRAALSDRRQILDLTTPEDMSGLPDEELARIAKGGRRRS